MDNVKNIGITVAITGTVALFGYTIYKCYRKKKRLSMSTLASCMMTGTIESIAETAVDLGKYG
jgi:hypothetical protein